MNPNIYCVRADFGKYTSDFIKGGYVAIGWLPNDNLSHVKHKDELYNLYRAADPDEDSNLVIGQQVGQISRFLFDIQEGDYVITPSQDTNYLHYGTVEPNSYYHANQKHRRWMSL